MSAGTVVCPEEFFPQPTTVPCARPIPGRARKQKALSDNQDGILILAEMFKATLLVRQVRCRCKSVRSERTVRIDCVAVYWQWSSCLL